MWNHTGKSRPNFAKVPGTGQESVWDYPRPPICVTDSRLVVVAAGELEIGRTNKAIRVLETASPPTFYIPKADVNVDALVQSSTKSFCEWKGPAIYWSVDHRGIQIADAGWSYPSPRKPFEPIRGHIAFYPGKLDCTVDGEHVRPQPGTFYGGWVTDEIVGPMKGEAGTAGW